MRFLIALALAGALSATTGCKKDNDDYADNFIGVYTGTYKAEAAGSPGSISFDNAKADVTKRSDTEVQIQMTPVAGLTAVITAVATGETRLSIPRQNVLSIEATGSGELTNNGRTLKLTLNGTDGSTTTFEGTK